MSKAADKDSGTGRTAADSRQEDTGTECGESVLQAVLAKPRGKAGAHGAVAERIDGVVIGNLAGIGESGLPAVTWPGMPAGDPLPAISAAGLVREHIGRRLALSFERGDPSRPVVLGLIHETGPEGDFEARPAVQARIDDERLTLTADREIVLQCGKSSITLTRAGKIILKGAYLSSHSSGVNRIKGGSVQIN